MEEKEVNPRNLGIFFIDFFVGLWDTDIGTFKKSAGRCTTAGGLPHHLKGGDGYANYIDVPCSSMDSYDQSKKQKPPLWQVTVSIL